MLKEVLAACLGDYYNVGFTLEEIDDHSLELRFKDNTIGHFSSVGATVAGVREACQDYLTKLERQVD